ncbi:MAG: ABC transporter permease [Candidatus Heimdallarchaeota archaeon]|nr:ABC transporter permease [Candidatus Heimdallarchaeota archaeon]
MNRIYLAAIRDLWFYKSRSAVILLAMILVIAFPIAFLNLPYNLANVIDSEEEEYQLAHINLFFDDFLQSEDLETVERMITSNFDLESSDMIIESRMHISSKIQSSGQGEIAENTWIPVDVISINDTQLPQINEIKLMEGNLPKTADECVILKSQAVADGNEVGENITIYSYVGSYNFTIVGLVESIEYSSFQLAQAGLVLINLEGATRLLGTDEATSIQIYFTFAIDIDLQVEIAEFLEDELNRDSTTPNAILIWHVREVSFRAGLQDALDLTSRYMYAASIFIFLVAAVIIYIVMNRYLNEQKTTLGAIYSYGFQRRRIIYSYFLRVTILYTLASGIGLAIARLLLTYLVQDMVDSWGLISTQAAFSPFSVIFTLISSYLFILLATLVAVGNLLRLSPYEAMRGKSSELKSTGPIFMLVPYIPIKIIRNGIKNLTRNRTRTLLTFVAFALALSFAWSLNYTNASIGYTIEQHYGSEVFFDVEIDIGFEDMYNFQLLEPIYDHPDLDEIEPHLYHLVKPLDFPERLIFLMSSYRNTSMFNFDDNTILEGRWFKANSSELVISRYVAGAYGYEVGSKIQIEMLNTVINSTVVGIANELISSSSVLIDLQYISYILNPLPDYHPLYGAPFYNRILATVKDGVNPETIQNEFNVNYPEVTIASTREYYERRFSSLSHSQSTIIITMATLGLIVGAVAIFTTLLISVVERERELALLQIFGYSRFALLLQVMVEGIFIGLGSIIPAYFLAQLLTKFLWVKIVSDSLFELFPYFDPSIDAFMYLFALLAVIGAVFPSFRTATQRELVEIIREE